MSTDSLRHRLRRQNLELLFSETQIGGPQGLARLLGRDTLKTHFTAIRKGRRGLGDQLAADIERHAGKTAGWLDQQHSLVGEPAPTYALAHNMSHHIASDDLPLMQWEDLVTNSVPDLFRAVLPDDALAPDFPAGTEVVWTTRRRAAPGRLILLKDSHGQLHARQCRQGRAPGQWLAAPINPAFVTFDSQTDGLQLVAVYKGRLEPDD